MFDEEKETREKSKSDWEKRGLVGVSMAYVVLSIATFTILAKFMTRENKTSQTNRNESMVKNNTPASVLCSCIAFAFGICILAISLGNFLWLEDSVSYVYVFLLVGLYAIYAAFSKVFAAPLQVSAKKSTQEDKSKFQMCFAYAAYFREMYTKKFGVAGVWFLHASIIKELAEISLQTRGLFRYAPFQDALITAASCSTLTLNCLLSTYGYVRQRRDAVIACDGIFDILYTVISATRIVARDAPISFLDALLLLFPAISIIDVLNSYAAFCIKMKSSKKSKAISRRMSSVLHLPLHDSLLSSNAKNIYKILLSLFLLCACTVCGISGYTLFRCVSQHFACRERYSGCLWRGAWPRKYLQKGIFGEMTCGEDHVRKIDAATCVHSKADMQSIQFENFTNMTSLHLGHADWFPPSLMSLARSETENEGSSSLTVTIETLPVILDLSNQNIDDFPDPMKKLLSAYEKTNVKSLNFSGNALDSATLLEWLNSVTGCSEDGSRGFCELRTIDTSRNALSDVPFVGLGNARFPRLSSIIARENDIYSINAQTAEWVLKEAAAIDLGNNNISDIALSSLHVGGGDLERLLDSLSQAASLDNIELLSLFSITGLEGGFSEIVKGSLRLSNLKTFSVIACDLGGDIIPSEVGMLSTLASFSAIDVGLIGSIPSQLGQLTRLTRLALSKNQLTGSIPSQLGLLTKLNTLDIIGNSPYLNRTLPWQVEALRPNPLVNFWGRG